MADDAQRRESTAEVVAEPGETEPPTTVVVGNKKAPSVNQLLKEGYEAGLRNLDKPAKKTEYEPFKW